MFTLMVTNNEGYNLNLQGDNFDTLKQVAKDYNKKGYDVRIFETNCIYEVSRLEN